MLDEKSDSAYHQEFREELSSISRLLKNNDKNITNLIDEVHRNKEERKDEFKSYSASIHKYIAEMEENFKLLVTQKIEDVKKTQLKDYEVSKLEKELHNVRQKLSEKEEETRNAKTNYQQSSDMTKEVSRSIISNLNERDQKLTEWQSESDNKIDNVLRAVTDNSNKMTRIQDFITKQVENSDNASKNHEDYFFDMLKDLSSKLIDSNNSMTKKIENLTDEFKRADSRALDEITLELSKLNNYHETFIVEKKKAKEDVSLKRELRQDSVMINKERAEIMSLKMKAEQEIEERMNKIKKEEVSNVQK